MPILEVVKESAYLKDGPPIIRHYLCPITAKRQCLFDGAVGPPDHTTLLSVASTSPYVEKGWLSQRPLNFDATPQKSAHDLHCLDELSIYVIPWHDINRLCSSPLPSFVEHPTVRPCFLAWPRSCFQLGLSAWNQINSAATCLEEIVI